MEEGGEQTDSRDDCSGEVGRGRNRATVKGKHKAWAISSSGKHCPGPTTDILDSESET